MFVDHRLRAEDDPMRGSTILGDVGFYESAGHTVPYCVGFYMIV